VIAVRMREHDPVEMVDARANQERDDDAFADRFGR
jgi:hypothetical protein